MELLSPAGNIEKLQYAYEYGADAAYIGLKKFSLRVKADNFYEDEYKRIQELKTKYPGKRLHCALNITFHNNDIKNFINEIDYFKQYPIDAFIVQDIGIVRLLQKHFPDAQLHVSTQANCINYEAVKMYKDMGFSRVVLGREASLAEIAEIKQHVPDIELEVFAHGAMCISYSGRCLLSAYMNGRSANAGFCSHSCRWDYDLLVDPSKLADKKIAKELAQSGALLLREHQRPDEYFPVFEGDDFTAILSSKDLCMVDHLKDLKDAGVDSLKIEGRMKSLYYVALVTRAYRKALDALEGKISQEQAKPYIDELYKAKHREFATGFYYNHDDADKTTVGESDSEYNMIATIGNKIENEDQIFEKGQEALDEFNKELENLHPDARKAKDEDLRIHPEKVPHPLTKKEGYLLYEFIPVNKLDAGKELEYVGPEIFAIKDSDYLLIDKETALIQTWASHGHEYYIYTNKKIRPNFIVRSRDPEYVEGKYRSTGR
ncbi:MAG: U32 family peptidase [Treponemataceae bacterium]|nr:U32 family peptidase [Treponemataceae bacterium]